MTKKELEKENELLKAELDFTAKTSNKNKQTVKEYGKLVDEYSSEGADLQDRIKELKKENAGLKARINAINLLTPELEKQSKLQRQQLTEAKEIIKKFLLWENDWHEKTESKYELLKQAEQFLKEI